MEFNTQVRVTLENGVSKALATSSLDGNINVVPISDAVIVDEKIWIFNYFFEKTIKNIHENPNVSIVAWSGLMGFQIKAKANYFTEGENLDLALAWVASKYPNRVLNGVVVLDIVEIFDISVFDKRI